MSNQTGPVRVEEPAMRSQDLAGTTHAKPLHYLHRWVLLLLVLVTALGTSLAALRECAYGTCGSVTIPVSQSDLTLYQVIRQADLTTTTLDVAHLAPNTITTTDVLSGSIAVQTLKAGRPITEEQIIVIPEQSLITDTITIAIEGGPALAFGGQLRPGMVLTAWKDGERQPLVDRLLLLTIKELKGTATTEQLPGYVLVLAVAPTARDQLVLAARQGVLSFTPAP